MIQTETIQLAVTTIIGKKAQLARYLSVLTQYLNFIRAMSELDTRNDEATT